MDVTQRIERPAATVYAFAADPAHLPLWAAGLSGSIEQVDGEWLAQSPMGLVTVRFAPRNDDGVLDHTVVLPDGEAVHNRLRVRPEEMIGIATGESCCSIADGVVISGVSIQAHDGCVVLHCSFGSGMKAEVS